MNELHLVTSSQVEELAKHRNAAEVIYPGLGAWTYDKFAELNERHYSGKVPLMAIQWHITLPYGNAIGRAISTGVIQLGMYTNKDWNLHDNLPCLFGEHVLLHEMLHHYLWAIGEPAEHQGDGWLREIMRLGRELGMKPFIAEPSKVRKVRDAEGNRKSKRIQGGDLSATQIATFPHFAFDYANEQLLQDYK